MAEEPILLIFHDKLKTINKLRKAISRLSNENVTIIENIDDEEYRVESFKSYHSKLLQWIYVFLFSLVAFVAALLVLPLMTALGIGLLILLGGIGEYYFYDRFFKSQNSIIQRFKPLVMQHENALIIQTAQPEISRIIQMLQIQVEPVAFFILTAEEPVEAIRSKEMLPHTPVSVKDLEKQATGIAKMRRPMSYERNLSRNFLSSVHYIAEKYQKIYDQLNGIAEYNENIHLSAEWLLDNAYTVMQSIKDIQKNLPEKFFQDLHFIAEGPQKGNPTIYPLVSRLVAATDGKITAENIEIFLKSYQKVTPLTIGELWAFPLVLQIRMIECLVHLMKIILERVRQTQLADFWANRILNALRREPEKLYLILAQLSKEISQPSPYFADQLMVQLGDAEIANMALKSWIQRKVGEELTDIFQYEQAQQNLEQTSLANVIGSLHRIKQMVWREEFEKLSVVDEILSQEASGTYLKQDFDTRDRYRHEIEKLSRCNKIPEWDVAKDAVKLTQNSTALAGNHVGYYLIDNGLPVLEKELGHVPSFFQRLVQLLKNHSALAYFSLCFLVTAAMMGAFYFLALPAALPWLSITLLFLGLFPFSELAIQAINSVIAHLLPPKILPKLFFKENIPVEYSTLMVTPTLLVSGKNIKEEVEKIEIAYLANSNEHVYFGLVTDFADASGRTMPEDTHLLKIASDQIRALSEKYEHSFYLFHRERQFNPTEKCWMGWERKRGKLEHLNRYLIGETGEGLDGLLYEGEPSHLSKVRYVLTVDSDTLLPKDSIKRLIETISHPLNAAYLDLAKHHLARGYTIIQPRVSTSYLSANKTWFSRLFSDPSGIDPYTKSVSDIYQDIFNEGVYHGKGLYDFKAFHFLMEGRLPENQILSHDLLEGVFVRTAFASDIELHDSFPENYPLYCMRQHRWIRGDWQIIRWLCSKIKDRKGEQITNPLTAINRWKIFDNLRRSLLPISCMLILLLSWFSNASLPWSLLILLTVAVPVALQTMDLLYNCLFIRVGPVWPDLAKGVLRAIVNVVFLPHQAWLYGDAILRSLYRNFISRKHLLQWTVSTAFEKKDRASCFEQLYVLAGLSLAGLILVCPKTPALICGLLVFWIFSPAVAWLLEKKYAVLTDCTRALHPLSRQYLRQLSRKTWRYFDDFVNADSNWLPPDNYQEKIKIEIAYRTSPTNIGFYLMSLISAEKFGYITPLEYIDLQLKVIETLKKLERYEGHFLNWYEIKNLQPLLPRYVSTVDSGNLLAAFWATEEKCRSLLTEPVFKKEEFLSGFKDTLHLFIESASDDHKHRIALSPLLEKTDQLFESKTISDIKKVLDELVPQLAEEIKRQESQDISYETLYWLKKLHLQAEHYRQWIEKLLPWISLLNLPAAQTILALNPDGFKWKNEVLSSIPSINDIVDRHISSLVSLMGWLQSIPFQNDKAGQEWVKAFLESGSQAFTFADEFRHKIHSASSELDTMGSQMNLNFLYNTKRKLFSIGYNVSERRLDNSYYDLLASEARLASFIAIARGDVTIDHWWALGRPMGKGFGMILLQSWGGTMFEYLMPVIWNKNFNNTLLDYGCKTAVKCQIAYGNQRGIPWGISESAYSLLDMHHIYQYRAFGVPYLGLKRGLEQDFVVTPYSTALALMIDPEAAIKNLRRLDRNEMMNGLYGFYEAIDYSREPEVMGHQGTIVHAYMAHHQGMSLSAFCNVLEHGYLQELFHSNLRVKALESILFERPQIAESRIVGRTKESPFPKLAAIKPTVISSEIDTPLTSSPITHLLSNGNYSVMVTNAGSGYSRFQDIDITRWRADATKDSLGTFFYVHEPEKNVTFNSAFQPLRVLSFHYQVKFFSHQVEIKRKDFGIETSTEIAVSAEDNVEVRCMTFGNLSQRHRQIEITSYAEVALAPHRADVAHPAFSKMFIETEAADELQGLLAHRRKRSEKDPERWCFHIAAFSEAQNPTPFSFETSREVFIGRDHDLSNPQALRQALSQSQGCVLDAIFAIRKKLRLEPGKRSKLSFITGYADSREEALKLMRKYKDFDATQRVLEMSWGHAELDLRRLHITHEDARLFQRMANLMIYPDNFLRAPADRIRRNRLSQERLWAHGISGDNPILLLTIADIYDLDVIHNALQAHAFWKLRGLKADLVIFDEERSGYAKPLHEHLVRMIQNFGQYTGISTSGGIYMITTDQISREDQNLIFTVANAVIVAERGTLGQQLAAPNRGPALPPLLKFDSNIPEEPSKPLPFLELLYFNGIGGFTKDGKEYAVYLDQRNSTPAPWINVIANENYGCLASETGLGMSWSTNSQANRISPWSNDPTSNPITDVCYIRDDESGKFWSVGASPIVENDPYRVRHGQGYTIYEHNSHAIEQEMTVFVPLDEAHTQVKVQILRLTNQSSRPRKLSLFSYVELTMGQDREDTQRYVITSWNYESKTLHAFNHYRNTFSDRVAFLTCSPAPSSFTGNRKEFIGRNGSLNAPEALQRSHLAENVGTALDPCFALQTTIELGIGESAEVIFTLGEAPHILKAKEIASHYQNHSYVRQVFEKTKTEWDRFLAKILVATPDQSINLLFNRWLTYQNLVCRQWARSAFYQSSGAYGYRDQLQDATSLVYFNPDFTKRHLLLCASRQFVEGDVQHWWHAETGNGVRSKTSDDLLWLPYVTMHYCKVTGDEKILDELIPYIEGRLLTAEEHEVVMIPTISEQKGSLLEHCLKAIDKALTYGPHGIPTIGSCDWNDGLSSVGLEGKGESVWLGWFLIYLLKEFSPWLKSHGDEARATRYADAAANILKNIEAYAWDGEWYIRAFYDDGTPIGSHLDAEDKIDSLPQSWSVMNGLATERTAAAMASVEKYLIDQKNRLTLLFTPPFDHSEKNPGYIKGYPPGVRENGGQYSHAACWVAMAYARQGDPEKAINVIQMVNPVTRSQTAEQMHLYRVEPYVIAADIYSLKHQEGRGGWTWYTGSASWAYRVLLEEIFGFKLQGTFFTIEPMIPTGWDQFELTYQHQETKYQIKVENPQHVKSGVMQVEMDGQPISDKKIKLLADSQQHIVRIVMGKL